MTVDISVLLARSRRKVARLIVQRDYWLAEHDKLHAVLAECPRIMRERTKYTDAMAEIARVSALEARVKEQAALIELLREEMMK